MQELASSYLLELRRRQPRGPYRLGGWSFGGVVAFEMALQLTASGEHVALLALLSSHLPLPGGRRSPAREHEFLQLFLREHGLETGRPDSGSVSARPLLEQAYNQAKRAGIVGSKTTLGDFGRVIGRHSRVYRLHVDMARSYRPLGRVPKAVLFEAQDGSMNGDGPFRDWHEVTDHLTRTLVLGDHFSILQEPNVDGLAEALVESASRRLPANQAPEKEW
jgi:thioesterase domain-containing protein